MKATLDMVNRRKGVRSERTCCLQYKLVQCTRVNFDMINKIFSN